MMDLLCHRASSLWSSFSDFQDIIPRYQTMRGKRVERRFGWDCHGLPVEALAQDALALQVHRQLKKQVWAFLMKMSIYGFTYVSEWEKTVTRMGRWVDFKNDYKTMDLRLWSQFVGFCSIMATR